MSLGITGVCCLQIIVRRLNLSAQASVEPPPPLPLFQVFIYVYYASSFVYSIPFSCGYRAPRPAFFATIVRRSLACQVKACRLTSIVFRSSASPRSSRGFKIPLLVGASGSDLIPERPSGKHWSPYVRLQRTLPPQLWSMGQRAFLFPFIPRKDIPTLATLLRWVGYSVVTVDRNSTVALHQIV